MPRLPFKGNLLPAFVGREMLGFCFGFAASALSCGRRYFAVVYSFHLRVGFNICFVCSIVLPIGSYAININKSQAFYFLLINFNVVMF